MALERHSAVFRILVPERGVSLLLVIHSGDHVVKAVRVTEGAFKQESCPQVLGEICDRNNPHNFSAVHDWKPSNLVVDHSLDGDFNRRIRVCRGKDL